MGSASFSVRYRPVRIGFVVRDGHIEDLEKAAGLNTLLWGGIYNPVIPVAADKEALARQLVDLFSVDILYAVERDEQVDGFLQANPSLASPAFRDLLYEDWYSKRSLIGYIDVLNVIERWWRREFKHAPAGGESNCTLVKWHDCDPLSGLFQLQFGSFSTMYDLKDDFEAAFRKGLRAREVTIDSSSMIDQKVATSISPIQLTGIDLQGYGDGFRSGGGLYIGEETEFTDLLSFWNLRAAGFPVLFFPMNHVERLRDLAVAHVAWLDELPHAHPNIEDLITFHYQVDDYRCREVVDQFTTQKRRALSRCSEALWNGLNVRPKAFYFSRDTCVGSVDRPYDRYRVVMGLPEKRFLPEAHRYIEDQQLAVSIQCFGEFEYPGHTLRPPPLRHLNEFYSREIAFDPDKLRVEREGVALITDVHEGVEQLYPLSKQKLLAKLFELAGIRAIPSKPGLLATRIIEQLGGIEGGRVFKIAGVRKLIQNRRPDEALPHSTVLEVIWDDGRFGRYENLFIEAREHDKLRKEDVFNYLLKKDFFRAGLELVCARCTLSNWLALRDIDDAWRCQYCGHEDRLSLHIRHRGDWKFRKSGLLAKDNNQESAIPVILSLLVFNRTADHPQALFSTALSLSTIESGCEVDYAVFRYGRDNQMEMAIGEAKSGGGIIDDNDIENMRFIQDKLQRENISCYLAFSKTEEAFATPELQRFERLREDGVPTILLTNRELEPYRPYSDEGEEKVPHKYAHTLSEMADNSAARYLR